MSEDTFQPITSQEELDQKLAGRLSRERERWSKESGVDALKEELDKIKREHYQKEVRRAVVGELERRGVDSSRVERATKLIDFDAVEADESGNPSRELVLKQVDSVAADVPELVRTRGAGSRGSKQPVFEQEVPLTREEIASMSPEEQRTPGMRERIDKFLRGQRSEGPDSADLR
jgi:hypothetical protein